MVSLKATYSNDKQFGEFGERAFALNHKDYGWLKEAESEQQTQVPGKGQMGLDHHYVHQNLIKVKFIISNNVND